MKTWHVIILAISIVVASVGSALVRGAFDRYQIIRQENDAAYRMDKLTGKVAVVTLATANLPPMVTGENN